MINHPTREHLTRLAGRTAAAGSAVVLAVSTWATWSPSFLDAAAINAGTAQVVEPVGSPNVGQPLESGGGMTAFSLALPPLAACTGDNANSFYVIQSYMVPFDVDPATLKYNANGPVPADVGANFRQPLFDTFGSPYVQQNPDLQETPGGPGRILNIPAFDFAVFSEGEYILPGTYNIGIACTKGPQDDPNQLDKFWNTQMTFTEDTTDPVGVKWTSTGGPPTTTPTTTTTVPQTTTPTTTAPPTTTTAPPTTTTAPPTTTTVPTSTTVPPTTTTTTTVPPAVLGGSDLPFTGGGGAAARRLPETGSSSRRLMMWAGLFGVLGLAASALGRESPRGGSGKRAS